MLRVVIWNEFLHEQRNENVRAIYPNGIHQLLAEQLGAVLGTDAVLETATLGQPEHGLPEERLASTDVLLWWGHLRHEAVSDEVAQRVQERVQQGMGLIVLHSAHLSKPFRRLMGTTCNLRWREADDREVLWSVSPDHPICRGVELPIVLERHEMYGEFFDVPAPDELVFISNFSGGEVFRSGLIYQRGKGRVFYFSPGHETYPVYHHPGIVAVLANAVRWIATAEPSGVQTATSPESPKGWFLSND